MVKSGLSSTNFIMFLKSLLCISLSLVVAYLLCVCLSNSDFNKNGGSEAHRLKKLTQSSFEMCAVNLSFIKGGNAATERPFSFMLVHFGSISDRIQGPFLRL